MKIYKIFATILLSLAFQSAMAADNSSKKEEKTDYIPRVSGMIDFRYAYYENKKDEQGFEVRRIRIGATGNLHRKVEYKMMTEWTGNVRLLDAYVNWKVMPELNVQAGQLKVHYSQEGLDGPLTWLTAEIPTAVSKLNGYNDLSGMKSNSRDIGLMLHGSLFHKELYDVLRYRVGVFNGNGNNLKDDNRKKDLAGMLWVNPLRHLTLMGSYYYGTHGPKGAVHTRNRASTGVQWKDRKLFLRSEYLWGNTTGEHTHGLYAHAAYTFCQWIQPVLSYDLFKQNEHTDPQHTLQAGVNLLPVNHLVVKVGYAHAFLPNNKHNNIAQVECVVTY